MINNWPDHYYSLIAAVVKEYIANNPQIPLRSAFAFQLRQIITDCEAKYCNQSSNEGAVAMSTR